MQVLQLGERFPLNWKLARQLVLLQVHELKLSSGGPRCRTGTFELVVRQLDGQKLGLCPSGGGGGLWAGKCSIGTAALSSGGGCSQQLRGQLLGTPQHMYAPPFDLAIHEE